MKNDALDVVLKRITDEDDWQALLEICDCKATIKLEELTPKGRALAFNKEIRSNYGNTFANCFRDEYTPDYSEILKATAAMLSIKAVPNSLTEYDVENLENRIIAKVLEKAKIQIIKEKGFAAWDEIEKEAAAGIDKLYVAGKIKPEDYEKLKKLSLSVGLLAAVVEGRVTGFALYMIVNQIFFAISRYFGLSIGVAVAGPIIGRTLAFLLWPVGWLLGGLSVFWALGDTNWKKTISTVVFIAVMRQKQKYGEF